MKSNKNESVTPIHDSNLENISGGSGIREDYQVVYWRNKIQDGSMTVKEVGERIENGPFVGKHKDFLRKVYKSDPTFTHGKYSFN